MNRRDAAALLARVADLEARVETAERAAAEARLHADVAHEVLCLAEASRQVPKARRIVLVEAPADYGNLRALGLALPDVVGADRVAVIARDEESAERWRADGVHALAWTTEPYVGGSPVWQLAFTAGIVVYEHHPWWREPHRLTLRALLAGSAAVQLWHGSGAPIAKDVGLLSVGRSPGIYQFADVVTTSVGYRLFVTEPRREVKRRREFGIDEVVHDIDLRMAGPLARAGAPHDGPPRVLLALTFPETEEATGRLTRRLAAYAAAVGDADVHVRHHTWTPADARAAAGDLPVVPGDVDVYDVLDTFDVLVTDASSLAADMLLLGRRVVLDRSDAVAYEAERDVRHDETMLALCDLADSPERAIDLAASAGTDTRAAARAAHAAERIAAIGGEPGRPTLLALARLLDEVG